MPPKKGSPKGSPKRGLKKSTNKQRDEPKKSPCNPKVEKEKTPKSQDNTTEHATMRYPCKRDGPGDMIDGSQTPNNFKSLEMAIIASRLPGLQIVPLLNNIKPTIIVHRSDVVTSSVPVKSDMTLEQYMKRLRAGAICGYPNDEIVKEYVVPSNTVGLEGAIKFDYVPEVYRDIIRGVIECVRHLHLRGLYLTELDLKKNFVVRKDTVMLFAIDSVTTKESEFRTKSWSLVKKVIQDMFIMGAKKEPKDIIHLYKCMEKTSDLAGEHLLHCHLAILGTLKRLEMIRGFHEKREYFDNHVGRAYSEAVRDFDLTKNWNDVLEDYTGEYGPILDCYNNAYEGPFSYSGTSNEDLLKFAHRMVVDLKHHFRKHTHKNYAETRGPTEHDVDLLIMMMLGTDLLKFQQMLDKKKLLKFFAELPQSPDSY